MAKSTKSKPPKTLGEWWGRLGPQEKKKLQPHYKDTTDRTPKTR